MQQRVLLIDPAQESCNQVISALAPLGAEVTCIFDGIAGLAAARSANPDLVLLDIALPKLDGFEVCRQLKAGSDTSMIPVIFLSATNSTSEKINGLELGASDYVTKPIDPAELCARVQAGLRAKQLLDMLAERAKVDGLTGLWNRAFFEERLEAELALARRTHRPVSCIMVDVDHFKHINDGYGHTAGDLALKALALILRANCRTEDVVCRWGGEEFAVLCPNTEWTSAQIAAERLRRVVAATKPQCGEVAINMTCSIGIADIATSGDATLVIAADKALYAAKNNGRNQVCSITDLICTLDPRTSKKPTAAMA